MLYLQAERGVPAEGEQGAEGVPAQAQGTELARAMGALARGWGSPPACTRHHH